MEYWASFAVNCLYVIVSMFFILQKKIEINKLSLYIIYIVGLFLLLLTFEFCPTSYRIIINSFIYVLLAYLLFKDGLKKSFLLGILMMILNIIAEIIYACIPLSLINHSLFTTINPLTVVIQNSIIGIIVLLISYLLGYKKGYIKIIKNIEKISTKQIIIFSLLCVVIFNLFMWLAYFVSEDLFNNSALSFVGSAISLFSVLLVFSYLKTNNKYVDISEKYNLSLENIKDYEQIIESNRVNNHEIRNQFLMLRNMSKNKKITGYIDSILNNNLTDSEELLNEVIRIPSGGLRGLIYTKLLYMHEQQIDYELYIDKKITSRKVNTIASSCMVDICKVVGVFLDNAIEAVNELKEKRITVEIFADRKDIVISITNNFTGYIDIENLENSGYTTKSEGRGYGLKLVSDILAKNNKLENYKELYEDNFTQNLKIKM